MAHRQAIIDGSNKHSKPPGQTFQYGTAGFRMKAHLLDAVIYRVALLASLRSRNLNGQTIGIMITASHNPPEDNGVKLVDPMGEMLEGSWEAYATTLANAPSSEALADAYERLVKELEINLAIPACAVFARDTRASGPRLVSALLEGLKSTDVAHIDLRLLTTPQLHYVTRCLNTRGTAFDYGEASEQGYYQKIAESFRAALGDKIVHGALTVDCANGVGAPKLKELIKYLPSAAQGGIDIKVVNDDIVKPESLNHQCGADFVKTGQRPPPASRAGPMERCCSLDGDADRLIYYFVDEVSNFHLLDGDRIATLAALFIGDLARNSGLGEKLRVGVVQTAYANGASTAYITQDLRLPITCTKTGVKFLHHAATKFDVGVYFEANGHGTVVFSELALKRINKYEPKSPAQASALETLKALTLMINQTTGDALSDILLVEIILAHKSWTPKEWDATYTDLPNRLVRVEVPDRNIFVAVDAERRLESPKGAQSQIDALVGKYKNGRSFARASGTEDAVRVYAEAATKGEADELATAVGKIVVAATTT